MTFLEKLTFLESENGLNNNTLSLRTGIPYTTIDGWFKRGYDRIKLSHLRKLGDFFSVSLDFLVRDNIDDPKIMESFLNEHEKKLISAYRKKKSMQQAVDTLLGINDETEENESSIAADQAATIRAANAFTPATTKKK